MVPGHKGGVTMPNQNKMAWQFFLYNISIRSCLCTITNVVTIFKNILYLENGNCT